MLHSIKTAGAMDVTRSGATVQFNFQKVGPEMMQALLAHGILAKVGDAAASANALATEARFGKAAKDVNKADRKAYIESKEGAAKMAEFAQAAMEGVLETLYAGDWAQGRIAGGVGKLPDDAALALRNAKQDLIILFKKVTGQGKLVDMAEHEKVAPFFIVRAEATVWNDEVVQSWIAKQAEQGKRDYLAEAKASLEVDLGDLDL